MRYETYGSIKDSVRSDLGLEQEDFITPDEMRGYCNAAIDDAESEIHTLYEDYFKSYAKISTVAGQVEYSLPEDIYANKIRGVVYNDGTEVYVIKRYVDSDSMFEDMEIDASSNSNIMKYTIMNPSAAGVELHLIPAPSNDKADALRLNYIRNANRMTDDDSICDIPEFIDYVKQFMKVRCYEKETHPNLSIAVSMLEYKKKNMINTLSNMVPDGDSELQQDMTFYWDMGDGISIYN